MIGLTETEYRTLRNKTLAILGELGAADNATATAIAANLVPTVEAILRERVRDAQRQAWSKGYAAGYEDCIWDEGGIPDDTGHAAHPLTNPYLGSAA